MSDTPPEEQSAERQVKTLDQFQRELDMLINEHMKKSGELTHLNFWNVVKIPAAKQELADIEAKIGILKVNASATLTNNDWETFLDYLNGHLANIKKLRAMKTIHLHQKTTGEKVVGITGGVLGGTAEVAGQGIRAVGSIAASTIGAIAETTFVGMAKILRAGSKGADHLDEKSKRRVA